MRSKMWPLVLGAIKPFRRVLGVGFLVIWLIGAIFPVIPGWPALLVAIVLLGRRDRGLRYMHLLGRRGLRQLRRTRIGHLRHLGQWLSREYVNLRRAITPRIIAAERALG